MTRISSALGLICLFVMGCGGGSGDLGTVSGKVTLDGEPLPDAKVMFYPKEGGRFSFGKTDSDGEYYLRYSRSEDGAKIGQHIVRITTGIEEDGKVIEKEKLAMEYNVNSKLVKNVESGSNEIDFELKSGGAVKQPGSGPVNPRRPPVQGCE